jgi:hypothetical protein
LRLLRPKAFSRPSISKLHLNEFSVKSHFDLADFCWKSRLGVKRSEQKEKTHDEISRSAQLLDTFPAVPKIIQALEALGQVC